MPIDRDRFASRPAAQYRVAAEREAGAAKWLMGFILRSVDF